MTEITQEVLLVRIDALEKLLDERKEHYDKALHLQATEYERRLDLLNGEAKRLRDIQATYLPREVYEAKMETLEKIIEDVKLYLASLQGKLLIVAAVIALGVPLITAVIVKII
jgi:hypothetical protein